VTSAAFPFASSFDMPATEAAFCATVSVGGERVLAFKFLEVCLRLRLGMLGKLVEGKKCICV
jgi:hypothetical protein